MNFEGSNPDGIRELVDWVSDHVILGAGDCNGMSKWLEAQSGTGENLLLKEGLAAETTYSERAARETAARVMNHLKVGKWVAFIATKRYYFGAGGCSDALQEAFLKPSVEKEYVVEAVEVYDDGSSNIRELLKVTSTAWPVEMEVG
jgi:hypothetical protein